MVTWSHMSVQQPFGLLYLFNVVLRWLVSLGWWLVQKRTWMDTGLPTQNLEIGIVRWVWPNESLANHTHRQKTYDIESETASTLAWCHQPSLTQLVYIRFSLMNIQPSSTVSKIWRPFPTPDRIFYSWR